MSIATLTAIELRKAATIKDKIEELNNELVKILGEKVGERSPVETMTKRGRRKMSAAGHALPLPQKQDGQKLKRPARSTFKFHVDSKARKPISLASFLISTQFTERIRVPISSVWQHQFLNCVDG
jgi:hypothetical protein